MKYLNFGSGRKDCLNFRLKEYQKFDRDVHKKEIERFLTSPLTKILPLIGCLGSLGGCPCLRSLGISTRLVGASITD